MPIIIYFYTFVKTLIDFLMDNSFSAKRRRKIIDMLDLTDGQHSREDLLISRIIELEDSLLELQESYAHLFQSFKKFSCVPVPF